MAPFMRHLSSTFNWIKEICSSIEENLKSALTFIRTSLVIGGIWKPTVKNVVEHAALVGLEHHQKTKRNACMELIIDCTKAIERNNTLKVAFKFRAHTYEKLDELDKCVEDMAAVCMLEEYQCPDTIGDLNQILDYICDERAEDIISQLKPCLPSKNIVKQFFESFNEDSFYNDVKDLIYNMRSVCLNTPGLVLCRSRYQQILFLCLRHQYKDAYPEMNAEIERNGPTVYKVLLGRATLNLLSGNTILAEEDLNRLLRVGNIDPKIYVNALAKLAYIKIQQKDIKEGTDLFKAAIQMDPTNPDLHMLYLMAALDIGDLNLAKEKSEKYAALNKNAASVSLKYFAQYLYCLRTRNIESVRTIPDDMEIVIYQYPNTIDPILTLSQMMLMENKLIKARILLLRASKIDSSNPEIFVKLAKITYKLIKNYREAIAYLHQAIEIEPDYFPAHEAYALIELQRGNLDAGLRELAIAIRHCRSKERLKKMLYLQVISEKQIICSKKFEREPVLFPLKHFT